jgi:hypothetical protein
MAGLSGLFWLLDVGLTDWDIVRGFCRDAGRPFDIQDLQEPLLMLQDCGIRDKGASPTSCQHTEQSKPHGQTRLRARGGSPKPMAPACLLLALTPPE